MQEKLDVYKELRSVDLLIDGKIKKESEDFMEDKFIDPITKVTMKQYQAVSASKPFGVKEMSDIEDLLKVDREIDHAKAAREMENLRPLIEIDQLVDGTRKNKKDGTDLDDVMVLLAVDREIDAAAVAASKKYLTGTYAQLYAVDNQIDHGRMAKKCHDDISALMELIATDKLVDGCKISRADDAVYHTYQALLDVDRTINGRGRAKDGDKNVQFIDPMTELSVRQYEARCHSARLMEVKGLMDVVDLLAVDLEIDGHKSYEA